MTANGLLFRGSVVPVDGVTIIPPASVGGPSYATLDAGDYRMREHGDFVHLVVAHTTKGIAKQHVIPGRGPGGRGRSVADFWRGDPEHSAAQIVIDSDGTALCLCDIALICAYHATVSNRFSVGVEIFQESDGGVYQASYDAAVLLLPALCRLFEFPAQIPGAPYTGHPLRRMLDGGHDVVGIVGHRDNTERRGIGDPGDELFRQLELAGCESFDIDAGQDLAAWRRRQQYLNGWHNAGLNVDGVPGPLTMRALATHGYPSGRAIPTA